MGITVWNINPSTLTAYYSPNRNVDSVSFFFAMHLRELFSLFSLLVMMMAPSECADVVKLDDDMAQGRGLWAADSSDKLEFRSDTLCCNGDVCKSGFMCGHQFPPADRCCPNGMKCTNSGSGCVKTVVKHEDEIAEERGFWTFDPNEELDPLSDGVNCCIEGKCHNGFMCGPHFLPADRCCPIGML